MVKGGELKEQTRRQWPLTDLTSVIVVLRCQHANQIKMNGAYQGHWRLASLGPISSAPVTVHIERLIERLTMPLREEETQPHTNRFPVDRRGGVIRVLHDRKKRWKHLRGGPPLWRLIDKVPQWHVHLWDFIVLIVLRFVTELLSAAFSPSSPPLIVQLFICMAQRSRALYESLNWHSAQVHYKYWDVFLWNIHINVMCRVAQSRLIWMQGDLC